MVGFNKCFFIGNLTRDPELRHTSNNTAVVSFDIAVSRKYKDNSGTLKEETCFLNMEAWSTGGETIHRYAKKGDPIFVEASARLDSWEDKNTGQKRNRIKFRVDNFHLLGPRRENTVSPNPPSKKQSTVHVPVQTDDIPF